MFGKRKEIEGGDDSYFLPNIFGAFEFRGILLILFFLSSLFSLASFNLLYSALLCFIMLYLTASTTLANTALCFWANSARIFLSKATLFFFSALINLL